MSQEAEGARLTILGRSGVQYPDKVDPALLETFPNRFPGREYLVHLETQEFTSLCPVTGQPDFGTISVRYVPGESCLESKSLKLYLFSYRSEPTFMETVVNRILDDLAAACQPRQMVVSGRFAPRGGIAIVVEASLQGKGA
jgi:7-cyano-7-deazaguanine reductase